MNCNPKKDRVRKFQTECSERGEGMIEEDVARELNLPREVVSQMFEEVRPQEGEYPWI